MVDVVEGNTMLCLRLFLVALGLTVSFSVNAAVIFESGPNEADRCGGGGPSITSTQWNGIRFSVFEPVLVAGIGGAICQAPTQSGQIFGAILSLDSPEGFPADIPSKIEDYALAAGLFTPYPSQGPVIGGDTILNLSISLLPGSYAIVFGGGSATGTGPFGATGSGYVTGASPPGTGEIQSLLQKPNIADIWSNGSVNGTLRYIVTGTAPSPSAFFLISIGVAGIGYQRFKQTNVFQGAGLD